MGIIMKLVYFICWLMVDNSGSWKNRSNLPKYELEAIVHAYFPAAIALFESEEGKAKFEAWKRKPVSQCDTGIHIISYC